MNFGSRFVEDVERYGSAMGSILQVLLSYRMRQFIIIPHFNIDTLSRKMVARRGIRDNQGISELRLLVLSCLVFLVCFVS